MKKIISLLALTFTLSATAKAADSDRVWVCLAKSIEGQLELANLRLPQHLWLGEVGVLLVEQERYCQFAHIMIVTDMCRFRGHTLTVGLEPQHSELVTRFGSKVDLYCEPSTVADVGGIIGGSN